MYNDVKQPGSEEGSEEKLAQSSNSYGSSEPDYSVWKQIILLHRQIAWKNFIVIATVFVNFQLILYDISFRERTTSPPPISNLRTAKMAMDIVYVFDVFSAIIYRKWTDLASTYGQLPRPIKFLIIDAMSVLPLDWTHLVLTNSKNLRATYLLSMPSLLRIYRLVAFFNSTRNSVGQRRVYIRVAEFLVLLFCMTAIAVAVMIHVVDMINLDLQWLVIIKEKSSLPKSEFEWFVISHYVMLTQITGHGLPEIRPGVYSFAFIVIVLVSLWTLQAFEIAYLTDLIIQRDYNRSLFNKEMQLVKSYLDDMNASKNTRKNVEKYYNYFWKKQGSSEFKITKFTMYPSIFLKECALEIAWDAYKHSHLFRDQPIPFLRNLAILFEREYYRPGEMIMNKFDRKNKLIYVVTGVVQLLSEEDDQSPVLSFSGGTILCESTLILSQRSLCNVVACTEVELHVLHTDKFVELMVYRYREIYKILQSRIRHRYWRALRMISIGNAVQKNKSHIVNVPACTDVSWLKQTLTILQNWQGRLNRKEKKDVQFESIFATTDFRYTFAHLDMLVISDDIATKTEQVCLNDGQLPWIFSPQSMILKYWDDLVLACCFAITAIVPTYVSLPSVQKMGVSFAIQVLNTVYIVDLIVTSSTAIYENDVVYVDIIDIISRRMHQLSYWADFISALPLDWIAEIFGATDRRLLAYCKLNRLVKMYKFEVFFASLETQLIMTPYKLRVIKYTFYTMIVTYLSAACILLVTCENGQCEWTGWLQTFIAGSNEDVKGKIVTAAFLYASQILVGIGTDVVSPKEMYEYLVSIPLLILGSVIFNYIISSVTACQILEGFTKFWLRFTMMNIAMMLDLNKVNKSIQGRVFCYLELEWLDNNAYVLTFERQIFDNVTPKVRHDVRAERFFSLLEDLEIFKGVSEECVNEICSICKLLLLPPREIVGYRGTECREMYVVEKGHCQVWRNVDMAPFDVTTGHAIYVIEMCCSLNNLHTVTTVTHVSMVRIMLKDLMHVLSQFPIEKQILDEVVKTFQKSQEFVRLSNIQNGIPSKNMMKEINDEWQTIDSLARVMVNPNIQNRANRRSKPVANNISEDRSWKEIVLMKFLLKSTISPDGRFIKNWETIRYICAYFLITLYSGEAVFSQVIPITLGKFIVYFLNSMMVADLYVRLNVQFYNALGILVTHPIATAKHYVYSGLLVDVLAVFPLERFFISEGFHDPKKLWFCRLNRLLMAHRIIGAMRYHYSWPYVFKYATCVIFLPLIILTIHIFACGLLHEFCDVGSHVKESEKYAKGIYCNPDHVHIKYEETVMITPMKMYIYSFLYVFGTITRIGAVNLRPMRYAAIIYVLIMTLISFVLLMIVTTYTVTTMSRRDPTLTAYQQQMTILMSYLKENKVHVEFRDEVVNYFEYFWILRRGTSIMRQMQFFPFALQEDVFWCIYGPSLSKSPGFSHQNESFFRSLYRHMKVKFYTKGSEIVSVNLVHSSVYFVHLGWAEAFGPDGTRIAVLGCGSIFGNFTGSATMRQTCSIVTRTHVEALVVESSNFFDLIMRHPETKRSFLAAMALNTDYLKVDSDTEMIEVINDSKRKQSSFILLPDSALFQAWEIFSELFCCYFAFVVCFYHIAVTQFSGYMLSLLYVVDLTFLIKTLLVFFTAYEDDLGDYVRDKTLIAERFRQSKYGLYLHVFTVIPFEILCIFAKNNNLKWDFLAWLRVNRALRIILAMRYFRQACNRLNINISCMRIFYALVILISLLHSASCLMIIVQAATNDDMSNLVALQIYIEKFHTVSVMFAVTSPHAFPQTFWEAFYFIVLFVTFYIAYAMLIGEVCAVVDVNMFIINEYERSITFFRDRVTRMNLTYVLRTNAWDYGSKLWKLRSGQQTPHLLSEAPLYLQYSVSYEMYAHHLLRNEIFGKLHEDFIRQLTFHFKDNLFFPGDRIVNAGDIDETIYFILKGSVNVSERLHRFRVVAENEELRVESLGPGQCFGIVQGLYERIPHTATYTAKTTTHIIYLYRAHWIYLLKYFPVTTLNLYKSATQIIRAHGLEIEVQDQISST